ncbi:integrase [Pseudomonas veronii]|uniref:Integrase n=2 Tax=Pseudomonas veronii TaxID=76761 RepID=A0A7Y1ABE7_PSEVE|nr:integrase [Pseudomonas veronii]
MKLTLTLLGASLYLNTAFIAGQLGHSIQVLLTTYAKWLSSTSDWSEVGKLEQSLIGTELVQA